MMNMMIFPRRVVTVIVSVTAAFALSGCTQAVPMKPAEDANNPECANVIVRLPDAVAELDRRETNAQSTGAWGNPAAVLLACGVEVPGPSTLPCVSINDIDWLEDGSEAPMYRFTTYGRTPAVQVVVDSEKVSATTVLVDLESAVGVLPVTGQCTEYTDAFSQ